MNAGKFSFFFLFIVDPYGENLSKPVIPPNYNFFSFIKS